MTRETTLAYKLGTLKVEPPPRIPKYLHRNGETEPPTQTGQFGFRGLYMDARPDAYGTHDVAGIVTIFHPTELENNREFLAYDCVTGEGSYRNAADFLGQWWGPIYGPWQDKVTR